MTRSWVLMTKEWVGQGKAWTHFGALMLDGEIAELQPLHDHRPTGVRRGDHLGA